MLGFPATIRWHGATYRVASVADLARVAASYLFKWVADTRISKQTLLSWLERLYKRVSSGFSRVRGRDSSSILPDALVSQVVQVFSTLSAKGVVWGDFIMELTAAIENPPDGYVWKVRHGEEYLIKVEPKRARSPIRGKRFSNSVLIGVWLTIPSAKSALLTKLRTFLKHNGGGFFYRGSEGSDKAYGGFVTVHVLGAAGIGVAIRELCSKIEQEEGGTFHLSAVKLDGLAESRPLTDSDFFKIYAVADAQFNNQYSLIQVVNGQVPEYAALKDMLRSSV